MSDERRGGDSPTWGRVGPEDPTADPATHPALRVPDAVSEQPTVAVPTGEAPDGPEGDDSTTVRRAIPATRTGGLWSALILSAIVLIFLLVFILQNTTPVEITFLWLTGSLPTGVALLFAAIAGVLLVAIPGTGRILQLRREARRH
ncbi:lipopolysaccharide assembly protein LapA domain-containing protein [Pseudonocardia nematodicida]|uniref:Lipopolysaccharide assembly protein LapA domain-containing protein n=1 Tax=Pseudonocardia nematodicida TaxID=1206997 RepID=A0ABV1KKA9_9PSEU